MTKMFPLVKARIKAGFRTQKEFAEETGLARVHLSRLEAGKIKTIPHAATICILAQAIKVKEEKIISWYTKSLK